MLLRNLAIRGAPIAAVIVFFLRPSLRAQDEKSGPRTGSAFAVHSSGKLLTNDHVVQGCFEVRVSSQGGEALMGRVQGRDARNDLALIALESPLLSVASFRRTAIRSGEDVVAVGFPLRGLLAMDLNVSKGIVSATAGLLNDTSQLQISAGVQPGNSGGPLLDSTGSVVGVVVAKLDAIAVARAIGDIPQNINFAIKAELAEVFLRSQNLEPQLASATSGFVAVADAVERARTYTFLVECDPGRVTALPKADSERRAKASEEETGTTKQEVQARKSQSLKEERELDRRLASAEVAGPVQNGQSMSHALVYVFRSVKYKGRAVDPSIQADRVELVRMDNNRFFSFWLTPGRHTLNAGGDQGCQVAAAFDSGGSYFFRVDIDMFSCFKLTPVDAVEANARIKKLKPLAPTNVRNSAVRLQ